MLLTFSGIDCSGKSTQIDLLTERLRDLDRSVFVFWLRPGYSVELDFLRKVVRRLSSSILPSADEPQRRQEAFERPGVSKLWLEVAVTDLLLQYGLKLRALLQLYDVVLCDRFLWDAVLDLELRFSREAVAQIRRLQWAPHLIPHPDTAFVLMLDHDEMLERMTAKDEPFPDPPAIRDERYERYRDLAGRFPQLSVIDAHGTPGEVHERLWSHVAPLLRG